MKSAITLLKVKRQLIKYISTILDKNGGTLKFAIKVNIIILWNTIPILNRRDKKYKLRVREF